MRYVSAAVNKTKRTNFPTHFGGVKHIMMEKEETEKEGRFNYSEIYAYVKEHRCTLKQLFMQVYCTCIVSLKRLRQQDD